MNDKEKFLTARDSVVMRSSANREGIGRLGEKTLHAVIKLYIEPDITKHEQKVGKMYADVKNDDGIFEIQTANFNQLRKKLDIFLKDNVVTVIYPFPNIKWLIWVTDEGELKPRRKCPHKSPLGNTFAELYKIKPYLKNPNLRFRLMLIDLEEYRLLNGWSEDKKRGSSRYERIPMSLCSEICCNTPIEYRKLLPDNLPETFTSDDFKKAAKISRGETGYALNVLNELGVVIRIGKKRNAFIYRVATDSDYTACPEN